MIKLIQQTNGLYDASFIIIENGIVPLLIKTESSYVRILIF